MNASIPSIYSQTYRVLLLYSRDLITQQYDEMVKAAVALKDGTATAEAILRRFNSYNVTHPTYRHSLCECAHDCTATHGELSARVSSGRSDGVLHILFDCVADLK